MPPPAAPKIPAALAGMSHEQIMALATLAATVGSDPKTRRKFVHLRREVDANAPIPADVMVADLEERLAAQREESEIALAAASTRNNLDAQRAKLINDGRYSEDDVKSKLEPFMQAKGVHDYELGATLYGALNAPDVGGQHEIPSRGTWQMPTNFKELVRDPVGHARRVATAAMGDIIRARRAA